MRNLGEFTAFILLICVVVVGCTGVGIAGTDTTIKPITELETELKQVREDIDKSNKQLENITGNVSMFEQRLTNIETNVTTISQQITQTVQYNESIKSIAWTIAGIYIILKILEFARALIIAKVTPGSTLLNLVKGKK